MELYTFSALLARMKYINRWGLMHSTRPENLGEHTMEVASLSHMLALLAKNKFSAPVRPEMVAVAALYHDAGEIVTGDLPTPVKYKNPAIHAAYKVLEEETLTTYLHLMPGEVREEMAPYITGKILSEREHAILKGADRLSALIKCIEEEKGGNMEFAPAKAQQTAALLAMQLPEVNFFIAHFLPAYKSTLDELFGMPKG